jgi:hypothetical protein
MSRKKRLTQHSYQLKAELLEERTTPTVVPFGLPQPILSGVGFPYTTLPADINGDSLPDVLAVATDGSAISWAANLGSGSFGPKQVIDPGTSDGFIANSYPVDFNGDGKLDVLTAGSDNLKIYLNKGMGQFAVPMSVAKSGEFRAAYAADFNSDGKTDVATITNVDSKVLFFRNDGGGVFTEAWSSTADHNGARAMTAFDANGDGKLDLVVGSNRTNKISLYANDGTGNFGPEIVITTEIAGIRNLYAADLNGDSKIDLVSAAYGG